MSSRVSSVLRAMTLAACVTAGQSCNDAAPIAAVSPPSDGVVRHISADLARNLDERGLFREASLTAQAGGEISATRARELAIAFIKTHGRGFQKMFTLDHRDPVNVDLLRPCGRTYYAQTPYEALSDAAPRHRKRMFGSWWLVTMCGAGGDRQVSVAVSVRSTDLGVRTDGRLAYPPASGGTFFHATGIPKQIGELPIAPEQAIVDVASRVGREVVETPRLMAPSLDELPQMARWELKLDHPATIMAKGRTGVSNVRNVPTVFYGVRFFFAPPFTFVAAEEQPVEVHYRTFTVQHGQRGNVRTPSLHVVRRRAGAVIALDTLVEGGR